MRIALYSLLIIAWLCPSLLSRPSLVTSSVAAVSNGSAPIMPAECHTGKTSAQSLTWHWHPDTVVKIYYLAHSFTPAESVVFSRAIQNWNSALREIDSQIVFVEAGESEAEVIDSSSIFVTRGTTSGKERLGEIRLSSISNNSVHLKITVSPVVTDLDALENMMTHELGHSLGLADCYDCKRGTTAMSSFKDNNKGNDVFTPSPCDKYVVALGYSSGI